MVIHITCMQVPVTDTACGGYYNVLSCWLKIRQRGISQKPFPYNATKFIWKWFENQQQLAQVTNIIYCSWPIQITVFVDVTGMIITEIKTFLPFFLQEHKKMKRDLEDEQKARRRLESSIKKVIKNNNLVWEETPT